MRVTFYLDRIRPSMAVPTKGLTARQEAKIYLRQLRRQHPSLQGITSWANEKTIGFRFKPSNTMSHTMYKMIRSRDRWDEESLRDINNLKAIDI